MMRPTYGSLFSGVGGMDMGFDSHMYCVFQVEWDKHASSILRRHWPDVPKWGDVQEVNGATLPPCDVLTFGSPCQDLSVAGKRAGLDGGRSSMFYEAIRIIKEMRDATALRPTGPLPRVAVWENVPGALSSNRGQDFGVVLDELAQLGAVDIQWRVLDAQHFGVPQRRRRLFVVAIFDPSVAERCPDPLLPVAEGRARDFASGRKKGQNATGRSANSPDDGRKRSVPFVKARRAQNDTDDETWVQGEVTPTLNAFDNGGESRATVLMPVVFDGTRHDDFRMDTEIVPTLKQRMGTGGGQVPMVAEPIPIQDGREMEKCQNGFGVGTEGDTASALKQRDYKDATPLVYDGYNQALDDSGVHRSLRVGRDSSDFVAQPVTASFKPGASADAYGIGYQEEMAPTLESGGGGNNKPAIIQPVTVFQPGTMIRLGGGIWEETVPTLRAEAKRGDNEPHIAQPYSFDTQFGSNANVFTDLSPTLKASQAAPSVTTTYAVRRLTPLECERLMGWPDDHTRWTDDGREQADSHRYKQCGNGVATPVARWIAGHIKDIL